MMKDTIKPEAKELWNEIENLLDKWDAKFLPAVLQVLIYEKYKKENNEVKEV